MSNTISISEFKELRKQGRVGKKQKGDKAKNEMGAILARYGFDKEYRFDKSRRFKFDWANEAAKVAIEYEGLMSEKSGHTTITGYTSNCDKYNLAACQGWRVLRYTALNYTQLESDLKLMLK